MIENEELLSVIPHRGKMLLLSRITDFNVENRSIEAEFDITEDCLFYDSSLSGIPSWTGFEFIAQAISAFVGIRDRHKKACKVGFILGVSQMRMEVPLFKAGSIIKIKADEIGNMDPAYVFEGRIFLDGKIAVEGKLTVMDVDDEQLQEIKKENNSSE